MYLTDYREHCLKDVITQLEPGLFKKVTGLDVKDFELLCSLNVFNASLMNEAIFSFKRYEDSSLSYMGLDRHKAEDIGGFDTVLRREEYEELFYSQQLSMKLNPIATLKAEDIFSLQKAAEAKKIHNSIKKDSTVFHKEFGKGTVSKISKDKKYIYVKFGKIEKMFVFLDAFEKGFLKA
jgi:hypothetical protein